jgi:LuxR family maltose regulon positive regulatory protein
MLETLERANLFTIPLDDERCWYRYHHLFSEFLRYRLHQTQPDQGTRLHR